MSTRTPPKEWPRDGSPAALSDLIQPVMDSISFAYKLSRINQSKDIPWDGLTLGVKELVICLDPVIALSAAKINGRSRTPLERIVCLAVQLGIEQGRRVRNEENELAIQAARITLDLIQG